MQKRGFHVLAVDQVKNSHAAKVALLYLDLTNKFHQQQIIDMIRHLRPDSIHLGLPSGTCSRARERALTHGHNGEQRALPPLRDTTNLYGLPELSPQDQDRVDAANELYSFTVQVLAECASCNIAVSIENPRRSWLWSLLTQMVLQTQNDAFVQWFTSLQNVDFSACMHGSGRDTHLRLLATPRLYDTLALDCDNSHQHLPWSRPPRGTRDPPAGEYPPLLCKRMASCLAEFITASGVTYRDFSPSAHTAMGLQRRSVKPLIPEFYDFAFLDSPTDKPGWRLLDSPLGGQPSESVEGKKQCRKTYKYGLQWTPEQFMQLANKSVTQKSAPQISSGRCGSFP